MALMAKHGQITPMPEVAVFADTQAEPAAVYEWLTKLEEWLPFPVVRVTAGSLADTAVRVRTSAKGNNYTKPTIPVFIAGSEGETGLMMRQCTADFKVTVIHRKLREMRGERRVIQWMGISLDEVQRMKDSRKWWMTNRYPLIDLRMTREDCKKWMADHGYPEPPRSACVFCPFHTDSEWMRLKTQDPSSFQAAIEFEAKYQAVMKQVTGFRGTPFLHRSLKPLAEVNFATGTDQKSPFTGECEGMCGV